ncbi:MAG: phasin family protein [Rickettsiales bacterium]
MAQNFSFNDFFKSSVDMNDLVSSGRRNMETASEINQIVVENAQAVTRRQAEIARDNVEAALEAGKELMSGGASQDNLAKQADVARGFFESSLANAREITEMLTKSSFEAYDVLNRRAAESMEEVSKVSAKVAKKKSA